jgi:hypothetical protein
LGRSDGPTAFSRHRDLGGFGAWLGVCVLAPPIDALLVSTLNLLDACQGLVVLIYIPIDGLLAWNLYDPHFGH